MNIFFTYLSSDGTKHVCREKQELMQSMPCNISWQGVLKVE